MSSPIETMLLAAICAAAERHRFHLTVEGEDGHHGVSAEPDPASPLEHFAYVECEAVRGSYRIDILISDAVLLAIECDGHDFHDRTKQQAAYDRARDRELLLDDVVTIRFTGSEIVHSPERCADEALRVFALLNARRRREALLLARWRRETDASPRSSI